METVVLVGILLAIIAIGAVIILINEGIIFGGSSKSNKNRTIIITGPSNAGKTSLFLRWTGQTTTEVVTSQKINQWDNLRLPFGSDELLKEVYSLVDIPGHSRLQYLVKQELEATRNNLICIVFVVDASAGPKGVEIAAQQLFRLLKLTEKRSGGVDVLIAANKFDVFNVVSAGRLQTMLEQAIEELRQSQAKGLGEVRAERDDEEDGWIGGNGEFKFSQLEGSVQVLDGSVLAKRTHKWEDHVQEVATNTA